MEDEMNEAVELMRKSGRVMWDRPPGGLRVGSDGRYVAADLGVLRASKVACPKCGARPGLKCEPRPADYYHTERYKAAKVRRLPVEGWGL